MAETQTANRKMLTRLMLQLLPVQILLALVGSINGIVSSFFASNYVGTEAMAAMGLYTPINTALRAVSAMLVGGATILCSRYMGQNQQKKMQSVFSLSMALSALIAMAGVLLFVISASFRLTRVMTSEPEVLRLFNRYLIGQAIGLPPLLMGNQLTAFLTMENKSTRATAASVVYIAVNLLLNVLFVKVLRLEAFGLALASAIGMWAMFFVEAQYFISGKSHVVLSMREVSWAEGREIFHIGLPGALSKCYQTVRGLIVNNLILVFVGSVGISAMAAVDNLLDIIWTIPTATLVVSRMLIGVSVGEEDRQSLVDVMRVMMRRYVPIMCAAAAVYIVFAVPLTEVYYRDPSQPVYWMTVWGFRIVPLCMPASIVSMHFVCYGESSGKHGFVHLMSLLEGVVSVTVFTALLIRSVGMNSVYIANVLNNVVTTLVIIGYAWLKQRRFPRNMEELMVLPENFGASPDGRMDLTIKNMDEVVNVAERVQNFCLSRGVDKRRAYLAGLALEEMAGNVVAHGFHKDRRKHTVDIRVVHKEEDVILRIKDDCVPFDPEERRKLDGAEDVTKNIGLRIVFKTAKSIQYQNILGLNVLTMRI